MLPTYYKFLGIILNTSTQDSEECFKTPMLDIDKQNKWRNIPHSWMRELKCINTSYLPFKLSAILIY